VLDRVVQVRDQEVQVRRAPVLQDHQVVQVVQKAEEDKK
jgi:hypothetical protein